MPGTLDFNDSFQQVLVNLNGAGSVTSGTTGTNTLTIFSTTGATNTFSGVISGSHPVSFNTTGGAATMILPAKTPIPAARPSVLAARCNSATVGRPARSSAISTAKAR